MASIFMYSEKHRPLMCESIHLFVVLFLYFKLRHRFHKLQATTMMVSLIESATGHQNEFVYFRQNVHL